MTNFEKAYKYFSNLVATAKNRGLNVRISFLAHFAAVKYGVDGAKILNTYYGFNYL